MMDFLNPYKWIIASITTLGFIIGLWVFDRTVEKRGYDRAVAEYTAKALEAEKQSKEIQTRYDKQLQDAQNEATKRLSDILTTSAAIRTERDGLRDELSASRRELSSATRTSIIERTTTLTDVFEQCARTVEDLAQKADRHAIDARALMEAWPH